MRINSMYISRFSFPQNQIIKKFVASFYVMYKDIFFKIALWKRKKLKFIYKSCHSLNLFMPKVEWLHGPNGVKPCYASISTLSILHEEPTLDTHSLKMHNFEICQKNMSKSLMIFFLTPAWLEKIVRSRNVLRPSISALRGRGKCFPGMSY